MDSNFHTLTLQGIGKNGVRRISSTESLSIGDCMHRKFLLTGLPWIPARPKFAQAPYQPLRHRLPILSIGNEFNIINNSLSTR